MTQSVLLVGFDDDNYLGRFYAAHIISLCDQVADQLAIFHLQLLITVGKIPLLQKIIANLLEQKQLQLLLRLSGKSLVRTASACCVRKYLFLKAL